MVWEIWKSTLAGIYSFTSIVKMFITIQFAVFSFLSLLEGKNVELFHLIRLSGMRHRGETWGAQNASAHVAGIVVRCLLI